MIKTININNLIRIISGFLFIVLLIGLIGSMPVYAAEEPEHIVIEATKAGEFDLKLNSDYIFNESNIGPGDSWSNTIDIVNSTTRPIDIAFLSITSTIKDLYLYETLDLELKIGDEVIYSGAYSDTTLPITDFYRLNKGESLSIDFTVSLPINVGNEAMNKEMKSIWSFEARYYPAPKNYTYTVEYVDDEGNKLLPDKEVTVKKNSEVTEYAPVIEGYTPELYEQTEVIDKNGMVITFIYHPAPPIMPVDLDLDDPYHTPPQTGVELPAEDNSISGFTFLIVLILCIVAAVFTVLRIRAIKKERS